MEEMEKLLPNPDAELSSMYYKLYGVYETIMDRESGPVEDLTAFLTLVHSSSSVASFTALDLFNMKGRQRSSSNVYAMPNYFEEDSERRAREVFINSLNGYIRKLESNRYGDNRIRTLYAYLMHSGLYGIISELYIPDHLKEIVDGIFKDASSRLDVLIQEVREYFTKYENEKLNQIIKSLDRILLSRRSDQVFRTLKSYEPRLTEEVDQDYLAEKRSAYLKFQDNPELGYAKHAFGLSDGSYYRNLDIIIKDLTSILDEESLELLTELFLRN